MLSKSCFALLLVAIITGGTALAADAPADVQKAIADLYAQNCALILDPTDANFTANEANLAPDYSETDLKGNTHTRAETIAIEKQQLKTFKGTACDNKLASVTQSDPATVVAVDTVNIAGNIQAPDGNHDFTALNKSQDTWKLVGGKWLLSASKDLRVLVKVDGNVVQDQGQ